MACFLLPASPAAEFHAQEQVNQPAQAPPDHRAPRWGVPTAGQVAVKPVVGAEGNTPSPYLTKVARLGGYLARTKD